MQAIGEKSCERIPKVLCFTVLSASHLKQTRLLKTTSWLTYHSNSLIRISKIRHLNSSALAGFFFFFFFQMSVKHENLYFKSNRPFRGKSCYLYGSELPFLFLFFQALGAWSTSSMRLQTHKPKLQVVIQRCWSFGLAVS